MNWLNRAEVRFGHLAIEGLPRIVVIFSALVYILCAFSPNLVDWLQLDLRAVMHGQVWRLFTYIFVPQFAHPIFILFFLLFQWWVGTGLEQAMGVFKFNIFFFLGMIGTTVAAWLTGVGIYSNFALYDSIFFGFAWYYPETVIYLMMILPVKVKWMAWFLGILTILQFLEGSFVLEIPSFDSDSFGTTNSWALRFALLAAFSNYFLFFGPEIIRNARQRSETSTRRRRFEKDIHQTEVESLHRCAVCGRTEITTPDLEFRVAKDGQEYCREHLPRPMPEPPPAVG